jgi:hypothetical protein
MTLWDVNGLDYPPELIGNLFPPEEMLFEYNGPLIFTFKTRWEGIAIAYLSDEDEEILRYVIAPINSFILENLKSGIVSVRNVLDQPMIWLADVTTSNWSIIKSWQIQTKDLPEDALPKSGVRLYPHLEPLQAIKAKEEQMIKWNMAIIDSINQLNDAIKNLPSLIADVVEEKLFRNDENFYELINQSVLINAKNKHISYDEYPKSDGAYLANFNVNM